MTINWQLLMPELIIILTFILVVIFDLFNSIQKTFTAWITIVGCAIALYVSIDMLQIGTEGTEFSNMIQVDKYSLFFNVIFLVSTILVVLISMNYLGRQDKRQGEYYLLILLATLGMMLMASGNELIVVFLGLELMSLSLYVLAGYFQRSMASSEAGMKYLLLGAFASGFFLYGIALIYGGAGTNQYSSNCLCLNRRCKVTTTIIWYVSACCRIRIQSGTCAVSPVGTRCLRRRTHFNRRIYLRRTESGGVCCVPENLHGRATEPPIRMDYPYYNPCRTHDDRWQLGCYRPTKY